MVAVPPRLFVCHVIVVVFTSFVPLHPVLVHPPQQGTWPLLSKCLPLADTIFTSFLSSVNQFLVFKTQSKEMAKLYCKSLVLDVYQIFSLLLCDDCGLGNFFRVVAFIYEWIESLQLLLSPHNTTPVYVPAPGSGSNLMSKYSVLCSSGTEIVSVFIIRL